MRGALPSASVEHWADSQQELEEHVAVIDDDLSDVEVFLDLKQYGKDEETSYFRMECPYCGDTVYVVEDLLDDNDVAEIECPNRHHTLVVGEPAISLDGRSSSLPSESPKD